VIVGARFLCDRARVVDGPVGQESQQDSGKSCADQKTEGRRAREATEYGRSCRDYPMANKLTIHIIAAMAEHERDLIANRMR
jgi:hypothetical protein